MVSWFCGHSYDVIKLIPQVKALVVHQIEVGAKFGAIGVGIIEVSTVELDWHTLSL